MGEVFLGFILSLMLGRVGWKIKLLTDQQERVADSLEQIDTRLYTIGDKLKGVDSIRYNIDKSISGLSYLSSISNSLDTIKKQQKERQ